MIDLRKYVRVIDEQGTIGSCAACATLLALELLLEIHGKYRRFSRLFSYYMARKLRNRVGQEGTTLADTFETLKMYGIADEGLWPYRKRIVEIEPSYTVVDNAAETKVEDYCAVGINEESIKEYLDKNIPVVIGLKTGRRFWKLEGPLISQVYMPVNEIDNRLIRFHAVTIVGYTDNYFIVSNSIGTKWGDNGFGILPHECICDIVEAFVIKNFAGQNFFLN